MKKAKSIRVVCVTPPQVKTVHVHISAAPPVHEAADAQAHAREMAEFAARREHVRAEIARGARRTSGRIL